MSTQECLDAYEIVQGLVTHPGLKPHQRRQAEALLKDIKANLENSDDEGKTSRPDDQQMGPAQTPPRPTPAISAAPDKHKRQPLGPRHISFRQRICSSRKTRSSEGSRFAPPNWTASYATPQLAQFAGALASKPQSTGISGDMGRALNSRGLRTFLSAEGDQFLASITASQNTHMSLQQPRTQHPPFRPTPHTNLGPSLSPRPRQPDIHEPTQRPTKYRFDNVRLEGMENDVAAKKARVGSPGSDDVPTASPTTSSSGSRPWPGPYSSIPIWPKATPAHLLPGTEFMTQDMFRNYTILRDQTQGPSANAQQERPKDRSGGTSAHSTVARSARSPSVELFVSGQLLPMQEVNRWNTELSTGISWTIESAEKSLKNIVFILDTLPQMISSHPLSPEKNLQIFENILKVAGSLSLITPDMVDMGKITTKVPGKDGHILAPNLVNFFAPPKNQWVQQAFDDKNGVYSAYAHFCQSYKNLGTTPSAPNTDDVPDQPWTWFKHSAAKLDCARTTHHTEHVQMLANLLIFGPTAAFTSLRKSQFVSLANANAMLELGSSVLKQKLALGISAPMPHSTFDNLRLHFLNFLVQMGFTQLDKDGVPNVDWKQVHGPSTTISLHLLCLNWFHKMLKLLWNIVWVELL
ncbi:hypothetical protein H4Q26_006818 [Puccinia striiformis f. sp. tritici PST-130]|nr:hypothetical protein H4Q26_006818 [Puccinia striiformis f. sp. tritici PST-130]